MAENTDLTKVRIINAPRELVWKVWTDPKHLAQWWGPQGFTNPVCEMDLKPGGRMFIHMKGPDGTIHPMDGRYKEVVKPERLVFISSALDANGEPLFEALNTITFEAEGNKTKLTMHALVSKIKPAAAAHLAGQSIGWDQTLDRLVEYANKV